MHRLQDQQRLYTTISQKKRHDGIMKIENIFNTYVIRWAWFVDIRHKVATKSQPKSSSNVSYLFSSKSLLNCNLDSNCFVMFSLMLSEEEYFNYIY